MKSNDVIRQRIEGEPNRGSAIVALVGASLAAVGSVGPWAVGLSIWNLGALAIYGFDVYGKATLTLSLAAIIAFLLATVVGHRLWSILGTILSGLVAAIGVFALFLIIDELDYIQEVALIGWGLVLLIVGALLGVGCGLRTVIKPRHEDRWYELPRHLNSAPLSARIQS